MKLNKKGFTLVELLAVIVILAIVMLVAVTAIGPAIENSKTGAFFSTMAGVDEAAQLYFSLNPDEANNGACVTIEQLVDAGVLQRKDAELTGKVILTVNANKAYTYTIHAKNGSYGVNGKTLDEMDSKNEKDAFVKPNEVTSVACS